MALTKEDLEKLDKEQIVSMILSMQDQIEKEEKKLNLLYEQIAVINNQRFGRRSEAGLVEDPNQLTLNFLFNEAEALVDKTFLITEPADTDVFTVKLVRKSKTKGKREADLKGLPYEDIDHTIPREKLEELFPKGYKELPTEDYKRLRFVPATFEVEFHHVHVYAGKDDQTIIRADRPADLLRNSILTPSLESGIINGKFVNAMPYDRMEKEFKRYGVNITSANMAGWTIKCSERYLSFLYDRLHQKMMQSKVLQADETPVLVSKDGRPAGAKSYMWVYRTGCRQEEPPIILYEYQRTRNASHPREFLKGFKGICVTDGYQVYHTLEKESEDLKIAGCWCHARRKFADAVKAIGDQQKAKETVAYKALQLIQMIFVTDKALAGLSDEEILSRRDREVRPLVEAFFEWLRAQKLQVVEKSETGKGISYCLNQEKYLKTFLDHADVPMENNASERAIRPFCVGKHNWHLIDTVRGAKASAIVYSLVETAKANNLKPFDYFTHLLTELPKYTEKELPEHLDDLLPWSKKLPENCIHMSKS